MFKKRKNLNIRARRLSEEEGVVEGEGMAILSTDDSNSNLPPAGKKEKKKVKEKTEPKKQQSVLSFEDELEADDGIMFQEKKSSLSYKLRKEMKKERKEKRREEKEKQRQAEGKDKFRDKDKNGGPTVSELDELGIRIINGREAEAIGARPGDSDSDSEVPGQHKFRPKGNKTPQSLDPWKKILQSGQIPDANMIHAIRKQRQQAREQGDIIPIDDTVRMEEGKGRLVRDDDNDRSDDEEGSSRMEFAVNQQARDRQQRQEAFNAAQDDGTDNSDHELEWEKQQLQKARASTKVAGCEGDGSQDGLSDLSTGGPFPAILDNGGLPGLVSSSSSISQMEPSLWGQESFIPASSSALPRPANYQAEGIIKRLQDSRTSLEEVYRRHQKEADTVIDDLVTCKSTISRCSLEQHPLTSIFQFYQDIRGYVTDLRDCLNEKVPQIGGLEEQVYALYRQRAQKMVHRRRQDVRDQNDEFSPFAGKGAVGDEYRTRRAAEREGRRTRRRREREKRGDSNHHDGMSTDDEESQSEIQLMQSELEHIAAETRKIYEDVEDDFSQLKRIMTRFEEWRGKDRPTYADAYVSYNLPKIFAPYIRLQMLLWNPLMKDSESMEVERMKWFNLLLLYGTGDTTDDDPRRLREDPDRKLMSHLVEKVVLVKLKELVGCWWDPLSHTQTVRLVNLVRHYAEAYPSLSPGSKPLRELTHAIINKIRDAIDNDIFIPMFPKNVYDNKNSGVSLFFQRQFWLAWKLLSSTLMWHKVLSDSVIHDLAVRSLLNLYLLPALNLAAEINSTDALDKCRNVVNALPRSWVKSEGTHVFLGRLEDFLIKLSEKLDPTTHTPSLKEVCDLLKSIGATTQAEKIAYKYL